MYLGYVLFLLLSLMVFKYMSHCEKLHFLFELCFSS